MLLQAFFSTHSQLEQPKICLNLNGLCLTYDDSECALNILLLLSVQYEGLTIYQEDSSLIVPHREVHVFLQQLGVREMELNEMIDDFYMETRMDRAERLAYESRHPSVVAQVLSEERLTIEQVGCGPRPNQLLAKIKLQMLSAAAEMDGRTQLMSPSRVTFIL